MRMHIVSSTGSDLVRYEMEELFPERSADGTVRFLSDAGRSCPYSVLIVPEHLGWAGNGTDDIRQSVSIAFLNVKALRKEYGSADHRFARAYIGQNLIIRLPETWLDGALCPKSAGEMLSCIESLPIRRCRFVYSVYMDDPYRFPKESVLCIPGDVSVSEEVLDDWDGRFAPASGDDIIGAFLSRVDWERPSLLRERDGFRKMLSKGIRKLIDPSFREEFN